MRRMMIFFFSFISISLIGQDNPQDLKDRNLVLYQGPIESIFFHPAIIDGERAFNRTYYRSERIYQIIRTYFNTGDEIKKILKSLYDKNYVLFEHGECFEKKTVQGKTVFKPKPIYLPPGKKPLLLTIDDLNYYQFTRVHGVAHRLAIDLSGNLAAIFVTKEGKIKYDYEGDIVLIIEDFIKTHPGFSHNGARGIIAVTGMEGVLGYPTHLLKDKNYSYNKSAATQVANKLKEKGWKFASHSYGHIMAMKVGYQKIVSDTDKWKKEVECIVGQTPYYIYAYGSFVPFKGNKMDYLLKNGFNCFFGVDFQSSIVFNKGPYVYIERIPIDGHYVRGKYRNSGLSQFFSNKEVIDPIRLKYDKEIQLAKKTKSVSKTKSGKRKKAV